jgi:hypothetical protein
MTSGSYRPNPTTSSNFTEPLSALKTRITQRLGNTSADSTQPGKTAAISNRNTTIQRKTYFTVYQNLLWTDGGKQYCLKISANRFVANYAWAMASSWM